jgi:protein TonB
LFRQRRTLAFSARFTRLIAVARSGQVLSARVIGSSGNPALDAEAVSLPRRANPFRLPRGILAPAF